MSWRIPRHENLSDWINIGFGFWDSGWDHRQNSAPKFANKPFTTDSAGAFLGGRAGKCVSL
jgi:hypothetical protein